MIWTIIYVLGFILAILGGLNIIRFDGSIKRAAVCSVMIMMGLVFIMWGDSQRRKVPIDYEVIQVQVVDLSGSKYRVTLKSGVNSTVIYVDRTKVGTIKEGDTITLTKEELEELQ